MTYEPWAAWNLVPSPRRTTPEFKKSMDPAFQGFNAQGSGLRSAWIDTVFLTSAESVCRFHLRGYSVWSGASHLDVTGLVRCRLPVQSACIKLGNGGNSMISGNVVYSDQGRFSGARQWPRGHLHLYSSLPMSIPDSEAWIPICTEY